MDVSRSGMSLKTSLFRSLTSSTYSLQVRMVTVANGHIQEHTHTHTHTQ
jgi:hypothetical protein